MNLYVFEFNRPPKEIAEFVRMLNEETAGWAWFAWDYAEFGLFTPSGSQRRSYGALKKALKEV